MGTEAQQQDTGTADEASNAAAVAAAEAAFEEGFDGEDAGPRSPEAAADAEAADKKDTAEGAEEAPASKQPGADDGPEGKSDEQDQGLDDDPYQGMDPAVANQFRRLDEQLGTQVRKINGRIGNVARDVKALGETQAQQASTATDVADQVRDDGGVAPTKGKITEAMKSSEKLEELRESFPDWADAMDELAGYADGRIEAAIQANQGATVTQESLDALVDQIRAEVKIEIKHSGWQQTVISDDFKRFATESAENEALYASDDPADVITLLDKYQEANEAAAASGDEEENASNESHQRDRSRLEGNKPPTRGNRQPPKRQAETAESAFLAEFEKS